jgi:hypothetical protein
LDLVEIQELRWDRRGNAPAGKLMGLQWTLETSMEESVNLGSVSKPEVT